MGQGGAGVVSRSAPQGLTLDTGALIALERGDVRIRALLRAAALRKAQIVIPSGVVAQAWRGGPRQARIARLLDAQDTEVMVLDHMLARAVGALCGRTGTRDVVDAQVALVARERGHAVVTTDPDDLHHLDPTLTLIAL